MSFQFGQPFSISDQPTQAARFRKILVEGLIVSARVGVPDHERMRPQRVRISLCIFVAEASQLISDDLRDVVCYDEIIQKLRQRVLESRFVLLETLAEVCASICMVEARVHAVIVKVEKLDIYSDVTSVGIEIHRSR